MHSRSALARNCRNVASSRTKERHFGSTPGMARQKGSGSAPRWLEALPERESGPRDRMGCRPKSVRLSRTNRPESCAKIAARLRGQYVAKASKIRDWYRDHRGVL